MPSRSSRRTLKNRGSSRNSRDSQKMRSRTRGGNNAKNLVQPTNVTQLMVTASKPHESAYDLELMLANPNVKNDVNKQTSKGLTALHYAVVRIVVRMTENVTTKGKNRNSGKGLVNIVYNNNSVALDNQVEKIQALIAAGADKTLKDAAGNTPVDLANKISDEHIKSTVLAALGGTNSQLSNVYNM